MIRLSRPKGVSLVELLIVFFVFSIIIAMVTDMSRLAIHSQLRTTRTVEARRLATIILTRLRREFVTCRALTNPNPSLGTDGWWSPTIDAPLTLNINRAGGTQEISYWLNVNGVLYRRSGSEDKIILQDVSGFEFRQEPSSGANILRARIRMKAMAVPITTWGRAISV